MSVSAWPLAGGVAAPGLPGLRSLTSPVGGVRFLAPVLRGTRVTPVSIENCFLPVDSEGRGHKSEITLADFGMTPKKPRRGDQADRLFVPIPKPFWASRSKGSFPEFPERPLAWIHRRHLPLANSSRLFCLGRLYLQACPRVRMIWMIILVLLPGHPCLFFQ